MIELADHRGSAGVCRHKPRGTSRLRRVELGQRLQSSSIAVLGRRAGKFVSRTEEGSPPRILRSQILLCLARRLHPNRRGGKTTTSEVEGCGGSSGLALKSFGTAKEDCAEADGEQAECLWLGNGDELNVIDAEISGYRFE